MELIVSKYKNKSIVTIVLNTTIVILFLLIGTNNNWLTQNFYQITKQGR